MADISKLKINDTIYNIKDATARTSIASKADIDGPTFTGIPAAPTAASGTNTTQIATTAFVKTAIDNAIANAIAASY